MKTLKMAVLSAALLVSGASFAGSNHVEKGYHKHEGRNYWHKHVDGKIVKAKKSYKCSKADKTSLLGFSCWTHGAPHDTPEVVDHDQFRD